MVPTLVPVVSMTKKSCCTLLWSFWPNNCSDAIYSGVISPEKVMLHLISTILTYGMQWCHWWCQYQRHHMTPMSMASWDADANDITLPKNHVAFLFQLSEPQEWTGAIDDVVGIIWHCSHCQWYLMTKKSCSTSFQLSWPKEMQWCHWWCCWHHIILIPVLMVI